MNILWKVIEEHPAYSISNTGNVKNNKTGRVLKPFIVNGYKIIKLNDKKNYRVHRLVAEAFLPNENNLPFVNHKDENKQNNHVDNLEWCDRQYNSAYSFGRKVLQIDHKGNVIKEWDSVSSAARAMGIPHYIIFGCCENNTGYNWKFKGGRGK